MSCTSAGGAVLRWVWGAGLALALMMPDLAMAQTANVYGNTGNGWEPGLSCKSAVVNVTAAATTEIVALVAGRTIKVCGWSVSMSAAGTAQWKYGTGTNCGTGTTSLTGAVTLATGTPWSWEAAIGSLLRPPIGNALCLSAVTGNVTGVVSYTQGP